jgi:hypothetical protein
MSKVDGLSLIFINFYVPALTPRLSSAEISLQLSENVTLFTVSRIYVYRCHQQRHIDKHQVFGAYNFYILYNVGDRTEPCGTPAFISLAADISPSTETLNFL